MLIGYARAGTDECTLEEQVWHLHDEGCETIYEDPLPEEEKERPGLTRLLQAARTGDIIIVYRLDRLARSTQHLLEIAESLRQKGAGLRSIREPWADTTSPEGRIVMTVFAGIADFERALIRERTAAGRMQARQRGIHMGRPPKLTQADNAEIYKMATQDGLPIADIAEQFSVHKATIYRIISKFRSENG
ncbi:recombinase family protein [Komagataeibacter intermedius]|uniref:Resolvase n=2 Tax=Komagataeibacter intermedius TaxID=66229 RepID=A0A0N1F9X5_9PROT|nr:recombinase family protein [Komagataeibacter intermedius]KPH85757.1 resolvase [Komagataeibacter intermedius AF2]GAN87276.1 DNA recombinase/resolvase [Komagataeibacter intermedius TF2]GBQ74786.1 DNA resolvase [Komagataeibacter intermedius NRIC 0521]